MGLRGERGRARGGGGETQSADVWCIRAFLATLGSQLSTPLDINQRSLHLLVFVRQSLCQQEVTSWSVYTSVYTSEVCDARVHGRDSGTFPLLLLAHESSQNMQDEASSD